MDPNYENAKKALSKFMDLILRSTKMIMLEIISFNIF